jgi:hypothetical protein
VHSGRHDIAQGKGTGHIDSAKPREDSMAKNAKAGDNRRAGAVKKRSQALNTKTGKWVKRDTKTGKFTDVKADKKPFKGVRKER